MLNEILVNQLGFLVGFETLNETVFQGDPSILISQAGVKGIDPESMIHILEKMNYGDKNIEANQFATIQNMIVESSLKEKKENNLQLILLKIQAFYHQVNIQDLVCIIIKK